LKRANERCKHFVKGVKSIKISTGPMCLHPGFVRKGKGGQVLCDGDALSTKCRCKGKS
jgi:hypothetical protein